jgi:adenosine deaminase
MILYAMILQVTRDVIREFAADNVKYLELRTTPRDVPATGMTKRSYIDAVIRAIKVRDAWMDCG